MEKNTNHKTKDDNITQGFTVEAIVTRVGSLADGGVSVGFHTKELNSEEKAQILNYHNKAGWLLFRENAIGEEDIPDTDAEYESKTPSQRLRACLYVYWTQQGSGEQFEDFYRHKMEKLIDMVKNKLS